MVIELQKLFLYALRHHAQTFNKSILRKHLWWENAHIVFMRILEYRMKIGHKLDGNPASLSEFVFACMMCPYVCV
jgi:hypothetical protein